MSPLALLARRIRPLSWSPVTESNRRPSPYHGDALPTELTGPVFTCLTWAFAIRARKLRPLGQCTALVPHSGPASIPKLAGRASGTEHSAPSRYTSLAMRILRHVVRTPPGPRFHAVGDRPVSCAPAGAPPRLPAGLTIAAEADRGDVTAGAARMLAAAASVGGGSRPVMPTPAPSAASPKAVTGPARPAACHWPCPDRRALTSPDRPQRR
jgi:hypothetical protein